MSTTPPESGGGDPLDYTSRYRVRHIRDEQGRYTGQIRVEHEPADGTDAVGWLDLEGVRDRWPESLGIDDPILTDLISAAQAQCEDYAPALPEGEWPPAHWRVAHLMQVQALWKSAVAGPGDTIGPDGLTVTVFPMDRTVKALLRPRRGAPVVA